MNIAHLTHSSGNQMQVKVGDRILFGQGKYYQSNPEEATIKEVTSDYVKLDNSWYEISGIRLLSRLD